MAFGKTGIDWRSTKAAVWRSNRHFLKPINQIDMVDADTLIGIDEQKALLYKNTESFLRGKPCCHALLWGAYGTGKSSLIRTLLTRYHSYGLRMIEIPRDDLNLLPDIIDDLHDHNHHFIMYCDDLLLDGDEEQREYRLLKNVMEGTLEQPPNNVLIYATSNWQRLMHGQAADNLNVSAVHDVERSGETVSGYSPLMDHFGLSLSFELMTEEAYLTIVDNLFRRVKVDKEQLHEEALRFAMQHGGGPSGRTAHHFLNHYQIYL